MVVAGGEAKGCDRRPSRKQRAPAFEAGAALPVRENYRTTLFG
jgi:hypothetical protein